MAHQQSRATVLKKTDLTGVILERMVSLSLCSLVKSFKVSSLKKQVLFSTFFLLQLPFMEKECTLQSMQITQLIGFLQSMHRA